MEKAYENDVTARECWDMMAADADAFLIDVRTSAEWNFAGFPLTPDQARPALFAEWQSYPTMAVNQDFAGRVAAEVHRQGGGTGSRLFFLCRSGVRSMAGAAALTAAGFEHCFNILDGFEGPVDPDGHRGTVAGWKADGLPWAQK